MVFKIIQNLFNNFYTQTTTPKNSKRPPQPRIIGVGGERVWHKLAGTGTDERDYKLQMITVGCAARALLFRILLERIRINT